MSEEAAFLLALKANPADDTARLVYADWLDDHDQPRKAEYLRLVAWLARAAGDLAERPEGDAIRALSPSLPIEWRAEAGARFVVTLFGYEVGHKINAIKHIREACGYSLYDAKLVTENLPNRIADRVTFERAHEVWCHVRRSPTAALAVLPIERDRPPFESRFNVVAECYVPHRPRETERLRREARAALAVVVARVLGVSDAEAARLAESESVVLTYNLSASEADARTRDIQKLLPLSDPLGRTWSLSVYPRYVETVATE